MKARTPNMQNIPIRTELGQSVRKMFRRPDGLPRTFLATDFDMLEAQTAAEYGERVPSKETS